MKTINLQLSERIRKLVNATEGGCATNIAKAFIYHRKALPEDALYVEGFWKVGGQAGPHAWIEADDQIIDPTYMCLSRYLRNEGVPHYPILRLSWDEAYKHYRSQPVDSGKQLDLILDYDSPEVDKVLHEIDPP